MYSMKEAYLKPESDGWFYSWFIYNEYDGNGRKTPKQTKNKEKFPVWLPSHPHDWRKFVPVLKYALYPSFLR